MQVKLIAAVRIGATRHLPGAILDVDAKAFDRLIATNAALPASEEDILLAQHAKGQTLVSADEVATLRAELDAARATIEELSAKLAAPSPAPKAAPKAPGKKAKAPEPTAAPDSGDDEIL